MQKPTQSTGGSDDTFWLFRISYLYYTMIGCVTVWIVSYPVSLWTEPNEIEDENLLAPFMRKSKDTDVVEIEVQTNPEIIKKSQAIKISFLEN